MQSEPRQEPQRIESALAAAEIAYRGMQVHFEFTTHAHFRLLRRLLPRGGKVRFLMDRDETLRAARISAFQQEIAEGRA